MRSDSEPGSALESVGEQHKTIRTKGFATGRKGYFHFTFEAVPPSRRYTLTVLNHKKQTVI